MAGKRGFCLPKSTWDRVDWSLTDREIAVLLGVRKQAVHQQRHRRGKGPSAFVRPAERFRRWVAANARSLDGLTLRAVRERYAAETGLRVSAHFARSVVLQAGLRRYSPRGPKASRLDACDWRLPTNDLAAVWGTTVPDVSRRRKKVGRRALWRADSAADAADPAYRAALAAEKAKAAKAEGN